MRRDFRGVPGRKYQGAATQARIATPAARAADRKRAGTRSAAETSSSPRAATRAGRGTASWKVGSGSSPRRHGEQAAREPAEQPAPIGGSGRSASGAVRGPRGRRPRAARRRASEGAEGAELLRAPPGTRRGTPVGEGEVEADRRVVEVAEGAPGPRSSRVAEPDRRPPAAKAAARRSAGPRMAAPDRAAARASKAASGAITA
jgi:hypothetical protein